MLDRAMQTLYKFALEPLAEITTDPNSYGFRPKRCVQDAIEQCFSDLGKAKSAKWVLEGNIKGCFDNISHDWILKNIPLDKKLLKKWLRSGYIETKKLFPTEKGTAKGSPISPTICNMVLDGLERVLLEKCHKTKKQSKAYFPKVNFVRYADDFIVTGKSKELLENGVLPTQRFSKSLWVVGLRHLEKFIVLCKRRHPKKSHKWIAQKYFHQQGTRNLDFLGRNSTRTKFKAYLSYRY